jgi:putative endonuclease
MASVKGDGRGARGRRGEEVAQALLEREGYRIVDTNVRFGAKSGLVGEIDVVAWDGATLAFVEVKTLRAAPGRVVAPGEAVTPAKQRQIARLALAYAVRHNLCDDAAVSSRFDVVTVVLRGDGETVLRATLERGAFLAPDAGDNAFL